MFSLNLNIQDSLIANSGHHYYFVQFPQNDQPDIPSEEKLSEETISAVFSIARSEGDLWKVARLADTRDIQLPWLRYRLANRENTPGVLIAIETNLGSVDRGIQIADAPDSVTHASARPSPYVAEFGGEPPTSVKIEIQCILTSGATERKLGELQISFDLNAVDDRVVPVDLIVDFGSTRTFVLMVEKNQRPIPTEFGQRIHPLVFTSPTVEISSTTDAPTVVDSWLLLYQPQFIELEMEGSILGSYSHRVGELSNLVPQMFVEMAPVIIGGKEGGSAREHLLKQSAALQGEFFLASPKRYLWDDEEFQFGWKIPLATRFQFASPNQKRRLFNFLGKLQLSRNKDLSEDKTSTSVLDRLNNADAIRASRSRSLVWFALGVLEAANRQLNSASHFRHNGQYARKIDKIVATFPRCWTRTEKENFKDAWEKALRLFQESRYTEPEKVDCELELDEGLASQLPFVYSECMRLVNGGFFNLHGRDGKVRVLNIDIGGGTTDVAVVTYAHNKQLPGQSIDAKVDLSHSFRQAGDSIVKALLEKTVILPLLCLGLSQVEMDKVKQQIRRNDLQAHLRDLTNSVFVPLAHSILGKLRFEPDLSAERELDANDLGYTAEMHKALVQFREKIEREILKSDRIVAMPSWDSIRINFPSHSLSDIFDQEVKHLFQLNARLVAHIDCDLVFVSGKLSELEYVKRMAREQLPIPLSRIIFADSYKFGTWYPIMSDGPGVDAKTVTAVGAAIYQEMKQDGGGAVRINLTGHSAVYRSEWAILPRDSLSGLFANGEFQAILAPQKDEIDINLTVGQVLGRRMLGFPELQFEAVYEVRPSSSGNSKSSEKVKLRRRTDTDELDISGNSAIELKVKTLGDVFWKDSGNFKF